MVDRGYFRDPTCSMKKPYALLFALVMTNPAAIAQCGAGEIEVTMNVTTDDYGYETYWQLVPGGDPCGTGTIGEGGNLTMNCSAGGWQLQDPGGYGDNTTYAEGPWCLIQGATYDLYSVDDWGDGQAAFEVFADGVSIAQFQAPGATNVFTFTAQLPMPRDMGITDLTTALYSSVGDAVLVRGTAKSFGTDVVTSIVLNYSIDGGSAVPTTINGLSLNAGASYAFAHAMPWNPTSTGNSLLAVWISEINGGTDQNSVNDIRTADLVVNDPIPNIVDLYLSQSYWNSVVANSDQDLLVPRDLDFHPDLQRNELWVINKDTEASGSSTVKFTDVGQPGMTFLRQEDPNNWHFMSLATGIAFGNNGNFSTCPGVFDANHNGPPPFTGISLWSSDPAIYAQNLFGPLGSHLDMLHVTPNSQGIAADDWNSFWVVDGYNGDVVMHDFKNDHGPGNDYHGNAVIHRYDLFQITRDPNDHIVSHCALDKNTGWLYVVDHGGQRIMRLNTATGTLVGPGDFGPYETYDEYRMMVGYDYAEIISTGLVQPAGIEVIGDRLLVSDHSNGDIVIYDLSSPSFTELGRIITNSPGIMGIKVGPDGRVWFVNATTHELVRLDVGTVGIGEQYQPTWSVHPNPTTGQVQFGGLSTVEPSEIMHVFDAMGRMVHRARLSELSHGLDLSGLANGQYAVQIDNRTERLVINR